MRFKRFWMVFLSCTVIFNCAAISAGAMKPLEGSIVPYVFGDINHRIPPNSGIKIGQKFSLNSGDMVSFDCEYVPTSASVDFGVIAPDGKFYFLNSTNGRIHRSIEVSQRGQYLIAIRNNSSDAVTVVGEINY